MKLVFLIPLVLVMSCGKQETLIAQKGTAIDSDIISNRPINRDQFSAILKLKSPALLATAKKTEDGLTVLDANSVKALKAEQEEVTKKLSEISKDIKILFKYRLVLNGLAILAPVEKQKEIEALQAVQGVERTSKFARPDFKVNSEVMEEAVDLAKKNSVTFINGNAAYESNITGKGLTVGIIDTGIDYTHSMMGGTGKVEDYKSVDPTKENDFFPNDKIVGGIDLVGTEYNAASGDFSKLIPKPDSNPMDEGGHGTHVAGSVAGLGDGTNTYNGVAFEAKMHAIKVFGANGSTDDNVIIAALEYAADPNKDLNLDDQLDVVNLSLGGGYGAPHQMYSEAVKNLVNGGTVMVASAGNSGHNSYIVGSPSTSSEAISVAASIDYMDHNIMATAISTMLGDQESVMEAVEAAISKKISTIEGDLNEVVVPVGIADKELSKELSEKVKGKIALIDRGSVPFVTKLEVVKKAGALGAIVANNQAGDAFVMGGDKNIDIPAMMISLASGNAIKKALKEGKVVTLNMKSDKKVKKLNIVDTLTDFSSRGPRSGDSLIKPEISAPGFNIISAAMGKGAEAVKLSGTSMSGPHMAGVMALLKQKFPKLSTTELKSVVLGTTVNMSDAKGKMYPIAMQGSGRVDVKRAIEAKALMIPATQSLGEIDVQTKKVLTTKVLVKNISTSPLILRPSLLNTDSSKGMISLKTTKSIQLKAGESKEVRINYLVDITSLKESNVELDGHLLLKDQAGKLVLRSPVLAVVSKQSNVVVTDKIIHATSKEDDDNALVELKLQNKSANEGKIELFNLLGIDKMKVKNDINDITRSTDCDLKAAGYRIVEIEGKQVLEVGVKTYRPLNIWQSCELSVQLDTNNDQVADQELAGILAYNLEGVDALGMKFVSVLLDANKAREIRSKFEEDSKTKEVRSPNYVPAVLDVLEMTAYNHSSIAIVRASLEKLGLNELNQLQVKIGLLSTLATTVEGDDYLTDKLDGWMKISPDSQAQSYKGLDQFSIDSMAQRVIELEKGEGDEDLLILLPSNKTNKSTNKDKQMSLIKANYAY